ncbi:hypothetical protein DL768_006160 [Monosporascus sp. mg162]|nr:hypothetical protein DL768_006160 [Monosporascus sp. mg162]
MSSLPNRSRTRQRVHKPPPPLAVPDIQEDAVERKRILNVIAQRRYRQRKREARLQAQASRESPAQASSASGHETPENAAERDPGDLVNVPLFNPEDIRISTPNLGQDASEIAQPDQGSLQWLVCDPDSAFDPASAFNPDDLAWNPDDSAFSLSLTPPFFNIPYDSAPNSNPPAYPLPLRSNHISSGSITASHPSSTNPPASESFPDSYLLAVPPLTLLRALLRVANRLKVASSVWSLTAVSPFNLGLGPAVSELPPSWQPTSIQLSVPHHPVLDLLPWPGVRDRLIGVMSLSSEGVDGGGGTGSRLLDFIYDMEDRAEGIRIWGSDLYDEANWEVGQVLFERWWFVFDRGVVERSNQRRRLRGAAPLRIQGPTVGSTDGNI